MNDRIMDSAWVPEGLGEERPVLRRVRREWILKSFVASLLAHFSGNGSHTNLDYCLALLATQRSYASQRSGP